MRTFQSRRKNRMDRTPGALLERLEQRSLLANSPFPLISDLVSPNDTVVRLQTNFGDIDFELFDNAAPITVANFLKYVRDGDFDQFLRHCARYWQLAPRLYPRGVFRFRSIEEAEAARCKHRAR